MGKVPVLNKLSIAKNGEAIKDLSSKVGKIFEDGDHVLGNKSGSLMSEECAVSCNILELLDKRYQGTVYGISGNSQQPILGRIHGVVRIGNDFFPISLIVVKECKTELIIGIDWIKKERVILDFGRNTMSIGTTQSPQASEMTQCKFLADSELPLWARTSQPLTKEIASQLAQNICRGIVPMPTQIQPSDISDMVRFGFSKVAVITEILMANFDREKAFDVLVNAKK